MLITGRKISEIVTFSINGVSIAMQPAIMYLKMVLNARVSFKEHLSHTCERVTKICTALTRLMLNTREPK